jgi:sulfite exporter TauE/SafE/copper chaperone CopZ
MTCVQCQNRIEQTLKNTNGVKDAAVNFSAGLARIDYDETTITFDKIKDIIENLDYSVLDGAEKIPALEIAGTLTLILALYALLRGLGIGSFTSAFPLAESGMDYGMIFIIGLATSLHCAAMCGGINLSQCLNTSFPLQKGYKKTFAPALLYNGGRVISYTITGAIVGAAGSIVSVSGRFTGAVQLAAGLFMVVMGINMLGFFPALRRFIPRIPGVFTQKIDRQRGSGRHPLFIGLLNGLMPCGPLQAMQLYALSTENPISGALSMFIFSIGTIPLMAGIGVLSSFLSGSAKTSAFKRRVMRTGAILVSVMGLTMLGYGFNLSGLNFTEKVFAAQKPAAYRVRSNTSNTDTPVIENGVQIVNSTLSGGRYPLITVLQGIPVHWVIDAPVGSINGCNNRMIIREYGIEYRFKQGENIIEFVPARNGSFGYSCWMGMIRGTINVVEDIEKPAVEPDFSTIPAGIAIPTENMARAELSEDGSYQTVSTALRDDGFDAAVLVLQRGLPTMWIINNDSLDPGNSGLIFPAYRAQVEIKQGENVIRFTADGDFDFSTADNVFYGYVKVVDDLSGIDIEAIREEAAERETLIYPDAYFETSSAP